MLSIVTACDALLQKEGLCQGCAKRHLSLPDSLRSSDLTRGAVVDSKQKYALFFVDLINTVLSSLYGQA